MTTNQGSIEPPAGVGVIYFFPIFAHDVHLYDDTGTSTRILLFLSEDDALDAAVAEWGIHCKEYFDIYQARVVSVDESEEMKN